MIRICDAHDNDTILSYIGSEYPFCLYLFLNLQKYGFDSGMTKVYCQQDERGITSVMLKYYSCLHVYSKYNTFDAQELGRFFVDNGFTMLYCAKQTAEKVYASLEKTKLSSISFTSGWVAQIKKVDKAAKGLAKTAKEKDFSQIVRLIYDDEDIGKSYKFDELAKQLEERNHEGYARNLVIKQDDLVIAHACTNAEWNNIAVVAELLVRKEYRRKGYATEIWRDLCGRLLSENKEVFSFYYTEESRALHKNIGFIEISPWAKIVVQ